LKHLDTYVEEKAAINPVEDALTAAMEAAYALVTTTSSSILPVPSKVWPRPVPATTAPPYGVVEDIDDAVADGLVDFGTIGKRVTARVRHASTSRRQAREMARRTATRLTGQAVAVTGFVVLNIRSAAGNIGFWDPDSRRRLYIVVQRWEFFLRPS